MPENDSIQIFSFDGQTVWYDRETELFEVGNFLGGGAAGTVYECEHSSSHERYALKILNPIGYKIMSPALLRRCNIICKGKTYADSEKNKSVISKENIWWLLNGSNKQYIASYYSEKQNGLRELSLNQCIDVWGNDPPGISEEEALDSEIKFIPTAIDQRVMVPTIPPKYADFVRRRKHIFREIRNMRKISNHKNVIRLEGVLELIQESKCTIFLVMELANGGELFDRIKIDCGTREDTAKYFFQQLLAGVKHCHDQGVCHRDLKPENLLLQDHGGNGTTLKIADFGFSARFATPDNIDVGVVREQQQHAVFSSVELVDESPLRVLKSVVGSPFYVAPEVMQATGYDGTKADVWSLGVILYAMLAGNLPFGQELSTCKRFRHFCKWIREQKIIGRSFWGNETIEYPQWLFPARFTCKAKGLIVSMLHPDPASRITVADAITHPLCSTLESELKSSSNISEIEESKKVNLVRISVPVSQIQEEVSEMKFTNELEDSMPMNVEMDEDNDVIIEDDETCSDVEVEMFKMEDDNIIGTENTPVATTLFSEQTSYQVDAQPYDLAINKKLIFPEITADRKHGKSETVSSMSIQSGMGGFTFDSQYYSALAPPLATDLTAMATIGDLLTPTVNSDDDSFGNLDSPNSSSNREEGAKEMHRETLLPKSAPLPIRRDDDRRNSTRPPSFHDVVKRSTRFITAVPAAEVLGKVESILERVQLDRSNTPVGLIGKVHLDWSHYRLEIWGTDLNGPPVCALQLYQLPINNSGPSSPDRYSGFHPYSPQFSSMCSISPGNTHMSGFSNQQLILVEFVRGQIEIFAFKRFYQWVRQNLSELVKRDYSIKLFDQSASPMVDSYLLQRIQQLS